MCASLLIAVLETSGMGGINNRILKISRVANKIPKAFLAALENVLLYLACNKKRT